MKIGHFKMSKNEKPKKVLKKTLKIRYVTIMLTKIKNNTPKLLRYFFYTFLKKRK